MKRLMLLSGMLLLALLVSACEEGSQAATSPLEVNTTNLTATLTPDERAKIRKDLLEVIEWNEAHPGEGQKVAPGSFEFEPDGWMHCLVSFYPSQMLVISTAAQGLPAGEQPAGQLVVRHGGQVLHDLEYHNGLIALLPLESIKGLARKDAIVSIFPLRKGDVKQLVIVNQMHLTPTPVPPRIDPDLLAVIEWEEAHPGEGRKVAPDDFVFGSNGWIDCTVRLDPDKIVVTSRWSEGLSIKQQTGGQLIIQYGGQPTSGIGYTNSVGVWMPLENIKALAQEDAVLSIVPSRLIKPPSLITATMTPF